MWSGYPGAGKTTVLRQMACQLAAEGEKVFFASLEEDPEDLMIRLCQVAYGLGIQEPTDLQNIRLPCFILKASMTSFFNKQDQRHHVGILLILIRPSGSVRNYRLSIN